MQPLDPTPSLQPHYRLSSLLRVGPPQCSASVRSPRGARHLCFSLCIGTTGSRSSAQKPGSVSRPLYAGRRMPSTQVSGTLFPEGRFASGSDDRSLNHDASSRVHFRSSLRSLPARGIPSSLPPTLTTTTLDRSSLGWFEACS